MYILQLLSSSATAQCLRDELTEPLFFTDLRQYAESPDVAPYFPGIAVLAWQRVGDNIPGATGMEIRVANTKSNTVQPSRR